MNYDAVLNIVHREVMRVLGASPRRIACTVDGYNPADHTVRVITQPDGTLSGWIQIQALQIGMMVAPNVNDPGWLEFHEGDGDAPVFVGSSHNDLNAPPTQIQEGEFFYKNAKGQTFYFKNDGSTMLTDGAGASSKMLDGAITLTDKANTTISTDGTGNASVKANIALTVQAPSISLGNGGALEPVMLATNQPSVVLKAQ